MKQNFIRLTESLREKKKQLILPLIAVLSLVGFLIYLQPGYGYEVSLNGKAVGVVKKPSKFENLMEDLSSKIALEKGNDVTYDINATYEKVKLKEHPITDETMLAENTLDSLELKAPGYGVFANGKMVMAVKSKKDAQDFLATIKKPFEKLKDSKKDVEVDFAAKVEIKKLKEIDYTAIKSRKDAIYIASHRGSIIEKTEGEKILSAAVSRSQIRTLKEIVDEAPVTKSKPPVTENKPFLDVMVKYKDTAVASIPAPIQEIKSEDLMEGETKVQTEGSSGTKEIMKYVTLYNGKPVEEKVLSEAISANPIPRVILVGTQTWGGKAVRIAKGYLGTPYVWGGTSPRGFDCSGFTRYVYAQMGISLPRTSSEQRSVGVAVSRSELRPGDLVFFPHHVGMYIGNDMFIHSPQPGDSVKISSLSSRNNFQGGRRVK